MDEFILVQDKDSHWFVIPDNKSNDWCRWCDLDEDDEASWDVPEYAEQVGGCYTLVKFKDYRID